MAGYISLNFRIIVCASLLFLLQALTFSLTIAELINHCWFTSVY